MSLPLFALFLAAFAVGTTEFVITGMLPVVAGDLHVSIPMAGYLISGYAAGVAIGGPIVAILTTGFERKATLLGLMGVFILGNALCAFAPSYGWLLAARLVISVSHGAFFGLAGIAAASLVREDRKASAISMVIAGISVANVIGVPVGTAIGNIFGWRATFLAITVLGLIATAGIALLLPPGLKTKAERPTLRREFAVIGKQEVYLSLAMMVLISGAFFGLFSFIAPILTEVSGVSPLMLPWLLVVSGVGSFLGNLTGGRLADWKLMPSVIVIFVAIIVTYGLFLVGMHHIATATGIIFVWAFVNFSFAAPLQARILRGAAEAPNLASTLVSTAFNIGIGGGAAINATALTHGVSYVMLPVLGFFGAVPALGLAVLAITLDRRAVATAPAAA